MTEQEALEAVRSGNLVQCTQEEYAHIRPALQKYASDCIDGGDAVRGFISLQEVRRLDAKFQVGRGEEKAHGTPVPPSRQLPPLQIRVDAKGYMWNDTEWEPPAIERTVGDARRYPAKVPGVPPPEADD